MSTPVSDDTQPAGPAADCSPEAILYGKLAPAVFRTGPELIPRRKSHQPLPTQDQYGWLKGPRDRQFSWTKVPDQEGWFYSCIKLPCGPGSRSGKTTSWRLSRPSVERHRSLREAKKRAILLKEEAES